MRSVTDMETAGYQDGALIRKLRKRQDYGLEQFAALIGITRQHLSNIENNRRPATLTSLVTIATRLSVPVADLLDEKRLAAASDEPELAKAS